MPPIVKLVSFTPGPLDLAVASARTCYSPRVILPSEVTPGQRERIGAATWAAGHHTPFQHASFSFALENVSRQLVWSFLHSHPYYNSDQSSQRYVALSEVKAFAPPLKGEAAKVYDDAIKSSWESYSRLSALLKEKFSSTMSAIGKVKGQNEKQIALEAEKKAIEAARYVLPIAAYTSLYHTISGVVLMRYARMTEACDCPTEARLVVDAMLAEVEKADPKFVEALKQDSLALESALGREKPASFNEKSNAEFDSDLGGHVSRLVSFDASGEKLVASAVREALGETVAGLSDDDAIELAVSPGKNPVLADTLNCTQHSPTARALNLVSYAFKKRISHTCDSQDQRHRTTPAARPLLTRTHTQKPDYIIPKAIAHEPEAKKLFLEAMATAWGAKNRLIKLGVPDEFAVYLLPNATSLRFTEAGRLIDLMHKWRMRSCFNAQEEIFDVSMDELRQVMAVHPRLTKFVGPPCYFRQRLKEGGESPCPEGARWCGIEVWRNFPNVKRPF